MALEMKKIEEHQYSLKQLSVATGVPYMRLYYLIVWGYTPLPRLRAYSEEHKIALCEWVKENSEKIFTKFKQWKKQHPQREGVI